MEKNFTERFEERLALLSEPVRSTAVKYAEKIFREENSSPEEAIERGIAKAEMKNRNL